MTQTPDPAALLERARRRDELRAEVRRLQALERRNSSSRRGGMLVAALVIAAMGVVASFFLEEGGFLLAGAIEVAVVCVVLLFLLRALAHRTRIRRLSLETLLDLEGRLDEHE